MMFVSFRLASDRVKREKIYYQVMSCHVRAHQPITVILNQILIGYTPNVPGAVPGAQFQRKSAQMSAHARQLIFQIARQTCAYTVVGAPGLILTLYSARKPI